MKCPILGHSQRFEIIQARLEQQHVVLHALLCYKILGLFYQELQEITILFLFSYPRIIRGIINTRMLSQSHLNFSSGFR